MLKEEGMEEERRMDKRRLDDLHTCVFHGERTDDIKALQEIVNDIPKVHAKMNTKINIGYGVFLAGALIVGIVFTQLDSVKADMNETQTKHELVIQKEQQELKQKITSIETKVNGVETSIAVVSVQITAYRDELRKDRDATKESLRELKEMLRGHEDY